VGVAVERGDQRHVRADHGADGGKEVFIKAAEAIDGSGAVQRHQHAVNGKHGAKAVEEIVLERAVAIGGERAAGAGAGKQKRDDLDVAGAQMRERAAKDAAGGREQFLTAPQFGAAERVERGERAAQVVGLSKDGA